MKKDKQKDGAELCLAQPAGYNLYESNGATFWLGYDPEVILRSRLTAFKLLNLFS